MSMNRVWKLDFFLRTREVSSIGSMILIYEKIAVDISLGVTRFEP